jgi:hypothetical protein
MKRFSIVVLATLAIAVAVACQKKNGDPNTGNQTPTTPTPTVTTSTQTFTVPLVAAAEVPAIANTESTAAGSATIKFNLTKTDGVLTAATADFTVNLSGFPAGSTVTLAHIHPGVAGNTGTVLVNTGVTSGQVPLSGGAGSFTKTGIAMTPDVAQSIMNAPSAYYFNVHSSMNPNGVMRGQLDGTTGVAATGGSSGTGGSGGSGGTTPPTDPYGYVDPTL